MSKFNKPIRRGKSSDWIEKYRGEIYSGEWPTTAQLLEIVCRECPDRMFLETFVPDHVTFTYLQARTLIRKIAARIRRILPVPDSKIIVSGVNSPEWVICYLAIQYSGNVAIPLDNMLREDEVKNLATFSEAKMAFIDSRKGKIFEGMGMRAIVSLDRESADNGMEYVVDWTNAMPFSESDFDFRSDISRRGENDLAAILFTSGTTGNPKGVMLTHRNLVGDAFLAQQNMVIVREDNFYALLPIHHAYAMVAAFLVPLSQGCKIVFGKRMIPKQIFSDVREGAVTIFLGVPALYNKVISGIMKGVRDKGPLASCFVRFMMGFLAFVKTVFRVDLAKRFFTFITGKVSLNNIKVLISGGGPLAPIVVKQYNRLGLRFVEGYGMTETSPIVTLNPIGAYKLGSVGRMVGGVSIRIGDPDANGNGLIWIKGPMVMKGYFKNDKATRQVIDEQGYLNTGDVGHLDSDGYLFLTGRDKNVIVTSGGKNVYPEEIENEFQLYGDIAQVMVAGYAQADGSEGIMAVALPSEDLVKKYPDDRTECAKVVQKSVDSVNRALPLYEKITRLVVTYEPFPLSSTGKIKRVEAMRMLKERGLV